MEAISLGSGIPELKNRVRDCEVIKPTNFDVIAKFLLIFRDSEFSMKIKFPSQATQKFYLYLHNLYLVTQLGNSSFIKNSVLLH